MDTPLFDGELVHARRMILHAVGVCKIEPCASAGGRAAAGTQPPASTRQAGLHLFFVVESGSGTLEYEGETRVLSAGDCVFLDCRRPYRHCTGDDLWQLRWAHFTARIWQPSTKNTASAAASRAFTRKIPHPTPAVSKHCTRWRPPDNYVRDMQICEGLFALLTLLMQERAGTPEIVRTGTKAAECAGNQGLS